MALTNEQLATLKAAIAAETDPDFVQARTDGNNAAIANFYNEKATPNFIVWKTGVTEAEILRNGMEWTRVDNLGVGQARIWEWMFKFGSIDASKDNIRAGIDAVWVGTQADLNVRTAVYVHCKRTATRGEKLFSTGTGSDASPAKVSFEGNLSSQDVLEARMS
jgi:hypothetical protein